MREKMKRDIRNERRPFPKSLPRTSPPTLRTDIPTQTHESQQIFQESLLKSCKRLQQTTVHLKPRTDKTSQEIMGTYAAIHKFWRGCMF